MAKQKPDKTFADYLAIAVCPLLIMVLVGSLTFFLQGMLYRGQFDSRVKWILFWFVVGSVLIARIAIESGRAHAGLFTLGLGAVVSLAVFKFVPDKPLAVMGCLALIWWLTDKLTWDSTLIDDNEDASGEGLLQVAGVSNQADLTAQTSDNLPTRPTKRRPLWMRLLLNMSERSGRPHAPGLWVVYFSLAALPVFGFGQNLIPPSLSAERGFAFQCLFIYVGAALGLLLLTSFLGLRRYLRQRGLQMPPAMAATWVGVGTALGLGILVSCLLLPRPQGELTLTAMIDRVSDKIEQASEHAVLKMDGTKDSQQPGTAPAPQPGQAQPGQAQPGQAQPGQAQPGQAQPGQAQPGQAQPGQAQPGQAQPGQAQPGQAQPGQAQPAAINPTPPQQAPPPDAQPKPSSTPETLAKVFRWGVYGVLALVAVWGVIKFWKPIRDFLANLWREFLNLFQWSSRTTPDDQESPIPEAEVVRTFAEFSNPFATGRARKVAQSELVRYTFEALQAWAAEQQCPRSPDQTPLEFGQRLIANKLSLAADGNELAQLYARLAYADHSPSAECLPLLERLWRGMKTVAPR